MPIPSKVRESKLDGLEALRGLAALYVLVHHARWLLWIGYTNGYLKQPSSFNFLNKSLVYFFSLFIYGHEAVIFFFVLSGFAIHLKNSRKFKRNLDTFNLTDYLSRRIKRIYPPLVFALLFTFFIDYLGRSFGFSIYGRQTPFPIIKTDFDFITLIGNLMFLTNTYVNSWGSNFALWSLKFEWWFYILYPVFLYVNKKSVLLAFILISGFYLLTFETTLWQNKLMLEIFSYLIIWWFGVLLADIYTGRINIELKLFSPLIILLPILVIFNNKLDKQIQDTLWGIGFFGFLALFLFLTQQSKLPKIINKLSFLGSFSFTLYIIHTPILVFLSGYLLENNHKLPLTFEYVFSGIIICLTLSWLTHFIIEKPFQTTRSR